jgi:hypothetical protein
MARDDGLGDLLSSSADFQVVTGGGSTPEQRQSRLADGDQLATGRLTPREAVVSQLFNEAGNLFGFRRPTRIAA